MPLYIVESLSQFRVRHVVEAQCAEHALDTVVMSESGNPGDELAEFSQRHLGTTTIDAREISRSEFDNMVRDLEDNSTEFGSPWLGSKLINVVKYGDSK